MKHKSELFVFGGDVEDEVVGEGVSRQILGYDDSLMLVRASFEEESEGYVHSHPHSQVTYIESGVFEFTVGSETRTLKTGDSAYIPPNVDHGAVCLEKGVLLDVFSPVREDFLT